MQEETLATIWEDNAITRQEEKYSNFNPFGRFNKMFIKGRMETELEFSHETFGEKFYRTKVKVTRKSGVDDHIPVIVSELLIRKDLINKSIKDKWTEISGEFRAFGKVDGDGSRHVKLYMFVKKINIYNDTAEYETTKSENLIYLDGYICKPPIFRQTPFGKFITELCTDIKRTYNLSDWIPCIAWGRIALWTSELEIGDRVKILGRVQSREYFKRYSEDSEEGEYKEIYEVSIKAIHKF